MAQNLEQLLKSCGKKFLQQSLAKINISDIQLEIDDSNPDQKYVRDKDKNVYKVLRLQNYDKKIITLHKPYMEFSINKSSQKILIRILGKTYNNEDMDDKGIVIMHDQSSQGMINSNFEQDSIEMLYQIRKHLQIKDINNEQKIDYMRFLPTELNIEQQRAGLEIRQAELNRLTETPLKIKKNVDLVTTNNVKRNMSEFYQNTQLDEDLYKAHRKSLLRGQAYSLLFRLTQNSYDPQSNEINNRILLQLYNPHIKKQYDQDEIKRLMQAC